MQDDSVSSHAALNAFFRIQTNTCTLLQEMSIDACQQMTYDPYT